MKVFNGFNNLIVNSCSVVTIGTYDGIHNGHKKVLEKLVSEASKESCESVVITFYPHPRHVLFPEQNDLKLIDTEEEKLNKFEQIGVDTLIVIPFTKEFAATPYITFVEDYLVKKLKIKKFVLGKDHRFGKEREGNIEAMQELAKKYFFSIDYVETFLFNDLDVSSTKIRKAIISGDLELANNMIGDMFSLKAFVCEGKKLGQTIGFPTANLKIENPHKLIPCEGVYAVWVMYENISFMGMLNIGKNPSVSNDNKVKIEVHILNFNKNIYGKSLNIRFVKRIRDEKKFAGLAELKEQLELDKIEVMRVLK